MHNVDKLADGFESCELNSPLCNAEDEFMLPLLMFKKYQIKRLFTVSAFMILRTALLAEVSLEGIEWWHFLNHAAKVFLPLAACWFVHGYFLTNNFKKISGYPKQLLSILIGFTILLVVSFVLDFILPRNYLFSREVGYEKMEDINTHLGSNAFLSVLCFIIFYSRHTSVALKKSKIEKDLLEKAHLRVQLISLQQQISPHFLFNSLSTLKTMVNEETAKRLYCGTCRGVQVCAECQREVCRFAGR